MSVSVQTCSACGRMHYPDALLCFDCAGSAFHQTEVATATVLAVTDVVHIVGANHEGPIRLALLDAGRGARVLARLGGDALPGSTVAVSVDGKQLNATPRS